MGKLWRVKILFSSIKSDILTWLTEILDYFLKTDPKGLVIPIAVILFAIFILGSRSTSLADFYLTLVTTISLLIFFYFIYKAYHQYALIDLHNNSLNLIMGKADLIEILIKQLIESKAFDKELDPSQMFPNPGKNYEINIIYILYMQGRFAAENQRRLLLEALFFSAALYLINPYNFWGVLLVIIFIKIYVNFENKSVMPCVAMEVKSLAWNIYAYHKADPEKCKKLVMGETIKEIKNLRILNDEVFKHIKA